MIFWGDLVKGAALGMDGGVVFEGQMRSRMGVGLLALAVC
jgi:hypothetical protein